MCTNCGVLNHFARACRIKNVKEVQEDNTDTDRESENDEMSIYSLVIVNSLNVNIRVSVWYENIRVDNKAIKVKIETILGLKTSKLLGLINTINEGQISEKEKFLNENIDNFKGLGKFKEKCGISLRKQYTPVTKLPRRIPLGLRDKFKVKLDEL
ncbi:hypothetical protein QE152_g22144 [Popillia japonica]|uniref:CCHC-type domain-containing protein n=1 Tax=Popillia japonica TaxID=7064 RepID=A0AAW1KL61_POPJA